MDKYTPGPWFVIRNKEGRIVIYDGMKQFVADCTILRQKEGAQ